MATDGVSVAETKRLAAPLSGACPNRGNAKTGTHAPPGRDIFPARLGSLPHDCRRR
jgi:hypothetical protein